MGKPTTSLYLKPGSVAKLVELAEQLGYFQTRGAGIGKLGSASALVDAVARGELALCGPREADWGRLICKALAHNPLSVEERAELDLLYDRLAGVLAEDAL